MSGQSTPVVEVRKKEVIDVQNVVGADSPSFPVYGSDLEVIYGMAMARTSGVFSLLWQAS